MSSSSLERDHSIREHEIALLNVSVGGYKIDGVMPYAPWRRSNDLRLRTACPERQERFGARRISGSRSGLSHQPKDE
jgi:hypothetical protein